MSPLFGAEEDEGEAVGDYDIDFDSMESEEFFDDLVQEAADELGTTVEGLEEMDMEDIDEGLGTEIEKPYHPRGAREGYRDTDRLKVVSKEELKKRKERVRRRLGL